MNRALALALATLALVLAVAVPLAWRGEAPPTAACGSTPCPRRAAATAPPDTRPHREFGPLPQGPFPRTRARLEQRALQGDDAAALRLGEIHLTCPGWTPMPDGVFDQALARLLAHRPDAKLDGLPVADPRTLDWVLQEKRRIDALCEGTAGMPPTARAQGERWIALAAGRGNAEARLAYADMAFREFADAAEMLERADEVARRRDRALAWLNALERAGDARVLAARAKAHRWGVLPRDRVRALAYWLAYRATAAGRALPPATADAYDAQYRKGLDEAGLRRAQALARDIGIAFGRRTTR